MSRYREEFLATPIKLKDGSWGARIPFDDPQDKAALRRAIQNRHILLTVRAKSGKTWTAEATGLVWLSDDGMTAIVRTASSRPRQRRTSGGEYTACAECGRRISKSAAQEVPDSSGLVGPCCPRCAALPAYERSFA